MSAGPLQYLGANIDQRTSLQAERRRAIEAAVACLPLAVPNLSLRRLRRISVHLWMSRYGSARPFGHKRLMVAILLNSVLIVNPRLRATRWKLELSGLLPPDDGGQEGRCLGLAAVPALL
jgi:hypothetical protein